MGYDQRKLFFTLFGLLNLDESRDKIYFLTILTLLKTNCSSKFT